jgi:hypothetical protein
MARSGAVPVPVSAIGAGLAMPVTAMLMLAVRVPVPVGLNVTLRTQLDAGATWRPVEPVGHVVAGLANANSLRFVPVIVMLVMLSGAPPVLLNVMFCAALVAVVGWLLNVRLVGEGVAPGGVTPVPERLTDCTEPVTAPESSVILSTAGPRAPAATGVKVIDTVQVLLPEVEPIVMPATQGLFPPEAMAKSEALVLAGSMATVAMCSTSVPEFVSVTV